jgi:integrase
MAEYAGRDSSRGQRLRWWVGQVGNVRLAELTDDHLFFALKDLADQAGRYWAGTDADGRVIYKAKKQPFAPATINRYGAALAAVCTWAIKNRIAPPGWENPFRRIQRMAENNEVVRFLTDKERGDLLEACRRSAWKKLYLFVLLALTPGARRGEIESLRWCDIISRTPSRRYRIEPRTAIAGYCRCSLQYSMNYIGIPVHRRCCCLPHDVVRTSPTTMFRAGTRP